ncbi:MAG TPA: ABC transporter ATP-binding protein [Candidatus Binataceae bacterium]|nr:ABC transporter ATP-binding protein [Candidatus Binataceae bacterium]
MGDTESIAHEDRGASECRSESAGVAIRAINLTAGYGDRAVLHGVSIDVHAGELLAIVGPNGAGKSTLLRILGGTLRPWSGTVELEGRPLGEYDRRAIARRLAIVAQENLVAFRFTVLEIVLMGRAPHLGAFHFETRHDLEIAHAALERFDLIGLARRPIQELSGGERKRVFLARALAQDPHVALLDEPTAFLDLRHVAEIFARLRELRLERGLAVIATLHDLNAAALHADRVLLMKDGAVAGYGTPDEVFTVENLRAVYETEVYVGRNPANGAITVLPGRIGSTVRRDA